MSVHKHVLIITDFRKKYTCCQEEKEQLEIYQKQEMSKIKELVSVFRFFIPFHNNYYLGESAFATILHFFKFIINIESTVNFFFNFQFLLLLFFLAFFQGRRKQSKYCRFKRRSNFNRFIKTRSQPIETF